MAKSLPAEQVLFRRLADRKFCGSGCSCSIFYINGHSLMLAAALMAMVLPAVLSKIIVHTDLLASPADDASCKLDRSESMLSHKDSDMPFKSLG